MNKLLQNKNTSYHHGSLKPNRKGLVSVSFCKSLFCLLSFVVLLANPVFAAGKLYVFYPTAARPQVVQKSLSDACPGVEITVFGRFKDFETKLELEPPDAIMANTPLIKTLSGFTISAEGYRDGKSDESYILLSVDQKIDLSKISETTIAVVDVLGRKGMDAFISEFFKDAAPKIKRVTKIEDLLPSLTFNMAQALLIPQNLVPYFKETSQLNFAITPLNGVRIGIISLATKSGSDNASIVNAVKALNKENCQLLGVEQWK